MVLSSDVPEAWHSFPKLPPHLDRWSPPIGVPAPHIISATVEDACFYLGAGEKDGAVFLKRDTGVFVLCADSPEYCPQVIDKNINLLRLAEAASRAEVPSDALPVVHLTFDVWYGQYHTLVGVLPAIMPFLADLRAGQKKVFIHADQKLARPVLTRLGVLDAAFFPPAEPPLAEPFLFCAPRMHFDFATRPSFPRLHFSTSYLHGFRQELQSGRRKCGPAGGSIVVLSRGGGSVLSNEQQMVEVLRGLGRPVEVLDTGSSDFARTLEVLSGADLVVGLHGDNMAHMLFAPEGAKVVEIVPQARTHLHDNRYWDLAGALNFSYVPLGERRPLQPFSLTEQDPEDFSDPLPAEKVPATVEVDTDKLKALVGALLP